MLLCCPRFGGGGRAAAPPLAPAGSHALIDTHAHLLPGIDDGATSLEETLRLAKDALATGFRAAVCTPHLGHEDQTAASVAPHRLPAVAAALADEGLPLGLHLGYELTFSFAAGLTPERLRQFSFDGEGRTLLVEVPYDGWPPNAEEAVFHWRVTGLVPVLAHPERNHRVQRDPRLLERLLDLGAVAQGTGPSLAGMFGPQARRCLLTLLSRGLVSVLASDAHRRRAGYVEFGRALAELERLAPGLDTATLTSENPRRLLTGEPLLPLAPIRRTRIGRFARWSGRRPA